MEPGEIIPLNNQLKICLLKVDREKARILQMLAAQVLTCEATLLGNLENLADFDIIHARAQLARSMKATLCPIAETGRMDSYNFV